MTPQQWPVTEYQSQLVQQRLFLDKQFYTRDQRANFVAVTHCAPEVAPSEEWPLALNTGRARDQWHTMTRTGLSAKLAEHAIEPYALIHPLEAKRRAIADGSLVTVFNATGECTVRAKWCDSMAERDLFVPIHWSERNAPLGKPCNVIDARVDALSGQPEFKYTPVNIRSYRAKSYGLLISREELSMPPCGYWAKQKIADGYLYRVESSESISALAELLQPVWAEHSGQRIQRTELDNPLWLLSSTTGVQVICELAEQPLAQLRITQLVECFAASEPALAQQLALIGS